MRDELQSGDMSAGGSAWEDVGQVAGRLGWGLLALVALAPVLWIAWANRDAALGGINTLLARLTVRTARRPRATWRTAPVTVSREVRPRRRRRRARPVQAARLWLVASSQAALRRHRVCRAVATAGAVGTMAVGVAWGVLQLDGGRWERRRRFWCVSPATIRAALAAWAWPEPEPLPAWMAEIEAWAAQQHPPEPYGRAIMDVVLEMWRDVARESRGR